MKIAMLSDVYLPIINGAIVHLIDVACELQKRGRDVHMFVPKPARRVKSDVLDPRVSVHYVPSIPVPLYKDFRQAAPLSYSRMFSDIGSKPDVIHFHSPMLLGWSAVAIRKMYKIPLVATYNTFFARPEYRKMLHLEKVGLDKNEQFTKALWRYSRLLYNQADIIVTPSLSAKRELINHGITKPVKAISNGIRIKHPSKPKHHLSLPNRYFVHVGRISGEKNIDVLVSAFATFAKKIKTVDLVIVGTGPATKDIKQQISDLGLTKRVHLLDELDHNTLMNSNVFADSLAFVTASQSETQGICLLEAMVFGLPLIGVDAGGVTELIEDNGILCRPNNIAELGNALHIIATQKNKRKSMSQASRKMVRNHSLEHTVDNIETLYKSLI